MNRTYAKLGALMTSGYRLEATLTTTGHVIVNIYHPEEIARTNLVGRAKTLSRAIAKAVR